MTYGSSQSVLKTAFGWYLLRSSRFCYLVSGFWWHFGSQVGPKIGKIGDLVGHGDLWGHEKWSLNHSGSKVWAHPKFWGAILADFSRFGVHFGRQVGPSRALKSHFSAQNPEKMPKNEVPEAVQKKHEILMKIWAQNERLEVPKSLFFLRKNKVFWS